MVHGNGQPQKQRRRIAVLYAQGLRVEDIAARLKCPAENVTQALRLSGLWSSGELLQVPCDSCQTIIYSGTRRLPRTCPVYCLSCLPTQTDVTFATRLKSNRLAAGLTQKELAEQTGLQGGQISLYEVGRSSPGWNQLVKLVRALGPGLLSMPPLASDRPRQLPFRSSR